VLPSRSRVRALVGSAFLMPALAWAEPPPPHEEAERLDPVVVTATKTAVSAAEAGSSVTVIEREEIETRQSAEMIDLLGTVPGLHVSEQSSRGLLSFTEPRGAPQTFTQVLIDGVKLNNTGGVINWAGLSLVNIERVEVVRGAQSGLYGVDAAGSVIQFFTTRGEGPPRAQVSVGGGNQRTVEATATLEGGHGPLGYSLGAHRIDTAGSLRPHSDFRSTTVSGRFDLERERALEIMTSFRFAESHHQVGTFVGGDRLVPLDPHQFVEQERLLLSGRLGHWLSPWWKQTLQLGYLRHDVALVDPFDPGFEPRAVSTEVFERRYSVDYFWTITLPPLLGGLAAVVTAGAAYEHETFDQRVVLGEPFPRQVHLTEGWRETRSLYLQTELDWDKRLFLIPGVRLDDSTVLGTEIVPRVTAAWVHRATGTKVRGAYGKGVRAPSFIQLVGDGGLGFVVGNPDLGPERTTSWEIGIEQSFADRRLELAATYFRSRFEELIAFVPGGIPSSVNVQTAAASGVELTLKLRPARGWTLAGSYTYLHTEVLDNGGVGVTESPRGAPLVRQPAHAGSVALDYVGDRLSASLSGVFVGAREDVDVLALPPRRVRLGGYARFDAAIAYEFLRGTSGRRALAVFGKARNITDERYQDFAGFSGPRATVLVGLRARY
jgi:vitamin B12 transporter